MKINNNKKDRLVFPNRIRAFLYRFAGGATGFLQTAGWGARGVLMGILGEGVLPGSPNPDPISDQKM